MMSHSGNTIILSTNQQDQLRMSTEVMEATYVIIGGGIAGVSCAEGLAIMHPEASIILISASPTVKAVTNIAPLSRMCTRFDVEEKAADDLGLAPVKVLVGLVKFVDYNKKFIEIDDGRKVQYNRLCLCTGARPKLIASSSRVVGLRDVDSVLSLQNKLAECRRIVIVGNGGIATELVYELRGLEIVWAVKDRHISATFIDPGAAQFFMSGLVDDSSSGEPGPVKRARYTVEKGSSGAALGPDWQGGVSLQGVLANKKVTIEFECEVEKVEESEDADWPVTVYLTNGKSHKCDLVVSATGVIPCTNLANGLELTNDGGIKVDENLMTSKPGVYAAGDVCTASWDHARHWHQMRLWTQARQMGSFAARSMHAAYTSEPILQDFCFELFTHVTKFFGKKVILLGLFNGQKLGKSYEILLRVTRGEEYVKLVLQDGRLQGAVLIGDTDLEEMCENLILNQLDLTPFGEDLLNPDIDIDDYFD